MMLIKLTFIIIVACLLTAFSASTSLEKFIGEWSHDQTGEMIRIEHNGDVHTSHLGPFRGAETTENGANISFTKRETKCLYYGSLSTTNIHLNLKLVSGPRRNCLAGKLTRLAMNRAVGTDFGSAETRQPVATTIWPDTGEERYIDRTHRRLRAGGPTQDLSDQQKIDIIRDLLHGPLYSHIGEESKPRALYVFCRTEVILRHLSPSLRGPLLRRAVNEAVARIISLRDQLSETYGPAFDVEEHYNAFGKSFALFKNNLPKTSGDREYGNVPRIQSTMQQLRGLLQPIGAMDP